MARASPMKLIPTPPTLTCLARVRFERLTACRTRIEKKPSRRGFSHRPSHRVTGARMPSGTHRRDSNCANLIAVSANVPARLSPARTALVYWSAGFRPACLESPGRRTAWLGEHARLDWLALRWHHLVAGGRVRPRVARHRDSAPPVVATRARSRLSGSERDLSLP